MSTKRAVSMTLVAYDLAHATPHKRLNTHLQHVVEVGDWNVYRTGDLGILSVTNSQWSTFTESQVFSFS